MALIDEAVIKVISGAGGNGCISFRREKYVPFGGPNGGSGGDGGSVVIRATHDKATLLDFKYQPKFEAERGEHGMGKDMYGRAGEDLTIGVPVGTLVFDAESGEMLSDLNEEGMEFFAAQGGKGGRGNMHFATSTNRAPRFAEPGQPGEAKELKLELRLMADVGIVGLPNAGKSSFLRTVTRATPKVADYPFTTLQPHLGVVGHKGQNFAIADLPGLIEGASEGVGLGHKFLRHVSRNRLLLHFVDISAPEEELKRDIAVIETELRAYDDELANRERLLVYSKCDLLQADELKEKLQHLPPGFAISSHTGFGVQTLLDALAEKAQSWKLPEPTVSDDIVGHA